MNARNIELVGEVIDLDTENKNWWAEHQKMEKLETNKR